MTPYCTVLRRYDTILYCGASLWQRIVQWCVVMTPYFTLVRGYNTELYCGAWLRHRTVVWCVVTSFSKGYFTSTETYSLMTKTAFFPYCVCSYQNSELRVMSQNVIICVWTSYITFDFTVFLFSCNLFVFMYVNFVCMILHGSNLHENYFLLSKILIK